MNYMDIAIKKARGTMMSDCGGPFGACIVKDGEVISISSNTVLKDNDPTAHAEVNAIREASKKLNTFDLSDCVIYTTSYPCPMCLSAIIWANIKEVYYGTDLNAAGAAGFRDDYIYNFIRNGNSGDLSLIQVGKGECLRLFDEYVNLGKKKY